MLFGLASNVSARGWSARTRATFQREVGEQVLVQHFSERLEGKGLNSMGLDHQKKSLSLIRF